VHHCCAEELYQLAREIESASRDTGLLALNVALEATLAGGQARNAAQVADAVGGLGLRATQLTYRLRACLAAQPAEAPAGQLMELRGVSRSIAELAGDVAGLAGNLVNDSPGDTNVALRLQETAERVVNQARSRSQQLDQILAQLPATDGTSG
jgi:methyl-accepting chemotaxis protein